MRLIHTAAGLNSHLLSCLSKFGHYSFATAWASHDTEPFERLYASRAKIVHAVIGTHFYQTHPNVLDAFVGAKNVRFTLQQSGVFHPKIYLFYFKNNWELMIGSANFTKGAFSKNSEAVLCVSAADDGSAAIKEEVLALIEEYWSKADPVTKEEAQAYRSIWHSKQAALNTLGGIYGKKQATKPSTSSPVMSMSWSQFYGRVKSDSEHGDVKRSGLLNIIEKQFRKHASFAAMNLDERKLVAGLPTELDQRWGWFGSMRGAGKFHSAIKANNVCLSNALARIPLNGSIHHSQYQSYINEYIKAFPEGRHGIATATRLLAMKRPDQFLCFDAANKTRLCADIGISPNGMSYDRYWDEVILRIRDAPWWLEPAPSVSSELEVWQGRAAMLDAIFYQPV